VAVEVEVEDDDATVAPTEDGIADPDAAPNVMAPMASRTLARGRVTKPRVARAWSAGLPIWVRMMSTPVEPPRPGEALPTVRQPEHRPSRLSGGLRRRLS
jgi:hypothetical protein